MELNMLEAMVTIEALTKAIKSKQAKITKKDTPLNQRKIREVMYLHEALTVVKAIEARHMEELTASLRN